jgi:hypothetical protein
MATPSAAPFSLRSMGSHRRRSRKPAEIRVECKDSTCSWLRSESRCRVAEAPVTIDSRATLALRHSERMARFAEEMKRALLRATHTTRGPYESRGRTRPSQAAPSNTAARGSANKPGTALCSPIAGPESRSPCYDIMLVTSLGRKTSMPSSSAAASTCE